MNIYNQAIKKQVKNKPIMNEQGLGDIFKNTVSSDEYESEDEYGDERKKKGKSQKPSNIVFNRFPKLVSVDENSHIAGGADKDVINQDGFGNPFS